MVIRLEYGESQSVDQVVYPRLFCDVCDRVIDSPDFNVEIRNGDTDLFYCVHKYCSRGLGSALGVADWDLESCWQPGDNFFLALMGNLGIIDSSGRVTSSVDRPDLVIP